MVRSIVDPIIAVARQYGGASLTNPADSE